MILNLAQGRRGWWKELNCIFCYEYMIDGLDFHLYITLQRHHDTHDLYERISHRETSRNGMNFLNSCFCILVFCPLSVRASERAFGTKTFGPSFMAIINRWIMDMDK